MSVLRMARQQHTPPNGRRVVLTVCFWVLVKLGKAEPQYPRTEIAPTDIIATGPLFLLNAS